MPVHKYEFREAMPSIWAVAQKPLRTEISVYEDSTVVGTATLTDEDEGAYLVEISEELEKQIEKDDIFIFPAWTVLETDPDTGYVTKLDVHGISFYDRTPIPRKIRAYP